MKIFIYKSLIITIAIVVAFKVTIGSTVKSYEKKLYENFNKQRIEYFKEKIRNELETAVKKDNYFSKEDAILINKFLNKIKNELLSNN